MVASGLIMRRGADGSIPLNERGGTRMMGSTRGVENSHLVTEFLLDT